jgi:hypothetical protein
MATVDFRVKNGLVVNEKLQVLSATDASSASDTAAAVYSPGGAAISQKLFVGTDFQAAGTTIRLGTSTGSATTATVGGAITNNTLKIAGTASGTANLTTDVTTGTVNLFTSSTNQIVLGSTGAVKVPVGTNANQPTGASGLIRYNTDKSSLEGHNGTAWYKQFSGGNFVTTSTTAPTSPDVGQMWFDSSDEKVYQRFNDGTSSFWVETGGAPGASSSNVAGALVLRDASGNFAAGTITATLSGNASTATNVQGGTAGGLPYNTASSTSTFLPIGTINQVLESSGTAPRWTNSLTLSGSATASSVIATTSFQVGTGVSTRTLTADNLGRVTIRYDDNSLNYPITIQNRGINAIGNGTGILFQMAGGGGAAVNAASIEVLAEQTSYSGTTADASLVVKVAQDGVLTERFRIDSAGNVTFASSITTVSVSLSVAANSTTQGSATLLTSNINVVTSATAAINDAIRLPSSAAGARFTIINNTAVNISLFPAVGAQIDVQGTNIAFPLESGVKLDFLSVSTTQWYTLNSTYA